MVTYDEALGLARGCVGEPDVLNDYENFFVFIDNPPEEVDADCGMVAVEKATGRCLNFVSALPRLGGELGGYAVAPDGALTPLPPEPAD